MTMDNQTSQTSKTVFMSTDPAKQSKGRLTDFEPSPEVERLEDRLVYTARIQPAESFSVSLNVLVSAAAPLLSEVMGLKREDNKEELVALNVRLCESMQAFDMAAAHNGAESSQVQAARYVLCTVVDEAVVTSQSGDRSEWSKMSLLSKFQGETSGGEKFFHLLDRVLQNPSKYLPLLELMYVCLSLGFEGKYRVMPRGTIELEAIRDSLYRQILNQRGEILRELSPQWEGLHDGRRSLIRIVPWWLVVIFTLISLVAMYSGFAWVLGEQRETVLQPYQSLDPISSQPQS